MSKKDTVLDSALQKLQHQNARHWGGYMTASEALALMDAGCKPNNPRVREYLLERKAAGDAAVSWHYFSVPERVRGMWNDIHRRGR